MEDPQVGELKSVPKTARTSNVVVLSYKNVKFHIIVHPATVMSKMN